MMIDLNFKIESVSQWGQRVEPARRSFLRQTKGLWVQVGETGFSEFEPVGIYLGDNLVLVVPPRKVDIEG